MGRPPIGQQPMTAAERQRRYRLGQAKPRELTILTQLSKLMDRIDPADRADVLTWLVVQDITNIVERPPRAEAEPFFAPGDLEKLR